MCPTPPSTLDYARRGIRRPFPKLIFGPLIAGPLAFFAVNLLWYGRQYNLVPAPNFVMLLSGLSYLLVAVGIATAVLCVFYMSTREATFRQHQAAGYLSALALFAGLAVFLTTTCPMGHSPWIRVSPAGTSMAITMQVDAMGNGGRYPSDFARFLSEYPSAHDKCFYFDRSQPPPPAPEAPAAEHAAYAAAVEAHALFRYTAADLQDPALATGAPSSLDPHIILLYTRKHRLIPRHRVVVFASSRAELVAEADLSAVFAASNVARGKLGLPSFLPDGPVPMAPRVP